MSLDDVFAIIPETEANPNFSHAARISEDNGQVIILKNNRSEPMFIDQDYSSIREMTDEEKIDFVAERILNKYKSAFLELAK